MAVARVVGAMHPIAVKLTRMDAGDITVPNLIGDLRQHDPLGFSATAGLK